MSLLVVDDALSVDAMHIFDVVHVLDVDDVWMSMQFLMIKALGHQNGSVLAFFIKLCRLFPQKFISKKNEAVFRLIFEAKLSKTL